MFVVFERDTTFPLQSRDKGTEISLECGTFCFPGKEALSGILVSTELGDPWENIPMGFPGTHC